MRLFADVAKHRSLSEAAAVHGISQSAASQRMHGLEKRLGVTLLDRTVRPVSLTAAGRVYLKGCQELLSRIEAIEHQVRMADAQPEGLLRVSAIYSMGIGWMGQVQQGFARRCPDAVVQLHYDRPDVIHQAVLDGQCDVGLVSFPEDWQGVGSILLRQEPMVLVCPPEHPFAESDTPVSLSALTGQRMVGISHELPMGCRTAEALQDAGAQPVVVDTFDNIDTLKVAVMETGCLALLPARTVGREQQAGALVLRDLEPPLSRPVGLIYNKASGPSPLVKAFADELLAQSPAPAPGTSGAPGNGPAVESSRAASSEQTKSRPAFTKTKSTPGRLPGAEAMAS